MNRGRSADKHEVQQHSGYVISLDIDGTGYLADRRHPDATHAFSLEQVVGGSLDFSFGALPVLYQLNESGRVERVIPVDPVSGAALAPAA